MGSRRAAGGGALGPSPWQRGPHPSRHGRLPLRSRRPACAAQPTSPRRQRHHRRRVGDARARVTEAGPSSPGHRLTPARRPQGRLTASLRDLASLDPWPRRPGATDRQGRGERRRAGAVQGGRAMTKPEQLVLWPRHQLTELPARSAPRRPRSGRLQAVRGRAEPRICENCRKTFTQVDGAISRSTRGRRPGAGTTSRSGSPSTPSCGCVCLRPSPAARSGGRRAAAVDAERLAQ